MKKMIALVLTVVMVCSLAACGGNSGSDTPKTTEATTAKTETQSESKTETAAPETAGTQAPEATEGTDAPDATEAGSDAAGETTAAGSSDTLIMATEAGFAPYEYTEDGETVIGVDVDIANEIAKAMGKKLEVQNMSFDGSLMAVQQGKVDFAAAGISVTEDRKKNMDFTIEYTTSKQVIIVNAAAERVKSVEDLNSDLIIGVQSGTVADVYCDDEGFTNKRQYNKFMEAALDLKNDKIDCIIMDSLPAEQIVAENPDLKILDKEVFTDKYAIAVQKGNTELLDQINAVLQQLMDEGKIEEFIINHTTK